MAIYSNVSGVGAGLIKGVDGISINKIRSINAALSSAFALLLDESYGSGAEAAYSVRRISGVYNGPLMVIRRDSDDATLEVGFNSSNDIDSSAIEVHCAGTTCYVTEWRDQSSNGNDATQGIETNQPTIYTGGALVTEGGRLALDFDTTDVLIASSITINGQRSDFAVVTIDDITRENGIFNTDTVNDGTTTTGRYAQNIKLDSSTGVTTIMRNLSFTSGGAVKQIQSNGVQQGVRHLLNGQYSGTTLSGYIDGVAKGSGTQTDQKTGTSNLAIGSAYQATRNLLDGKIQELITFQADKGSDRTSIESNIGDYYTQTTPLLDTYTGSAAAYSLRKLSSSYSGPLVRVREDGGDTQADIYANVFGELDTVSLAAHCGSNNGFVVSWLDQSGSSNTATQPADASQPKIYDGTTGVVTENGKAAVDLIDTSDFLSVGLSLTQPCTIFSANKAEYNGTFSVISRGGIPGIWYGYLNDGTYGVYAGSWLTANGSAAQRLDAFFINGSTSELYQDGSLLVSGNTGTANSSGNNIGHSQPGQNITGTIQELIFYNSNQSANRTNIEDNINTFYDIFPGTELIDEYSGAAAAYSLRSLSEQYDGAVVTVRRDSDDAQKNIYTLSDGQIDTNALEGFCGKSDGFVVRWFDQSSNSNHVTQPADSGQPKIYDGSSQRVVTENGKPAIYFLNGTKQLAKTSNWGGTNVNTCDIVNVHRRASGSGNPLFWYQASFQVTNYGTPTYGLGWGNPTTGPAADTNQNIFYGKASNTVGQIFLNNVASTAGTLSGTRYFSGSFAFQGRPGFLTYNAPEIYQQEFIQWDLNQSNANRTAIEENINENYLIYQPRTSPTSGLLADYSGAAAAYSLRQLSNKAVMAVKVRRDSDDAQVNIGFVGGDLDTVSLSAFCGTSDGFVVEWVDQSTNGNHATQPADTQQPKIYDGGSQRVITDTQNKPVLSFSGGQQLLTGTMTAASQPVTAISFVDTTNSPTQAGWFYSLGQSQYAAIQDDGTRGRMYAGSSFVVGGAGSGANTRRLDFSLFDGANSEIYLNSISRLTGNPGSNGITSIRIGGLNNTNFNGLFGELIAYPTDQSANRTNIEDNIFSHYSPAPLLDTYSGAAAAYSLRKLSSSATNAVQVRRDSDDATQYIGFVQDVFNGQSLDTATLSAFCGSANGFVTEWVDQSSNSNNATQAIAPAQPKIYDGTTGVITINGKPAIYTDRDSNASGDKLITPATTWMNANLEYACITVFQPGSGNFGDTWVWDSSGGGTNRAPSIKSVSGIGIQMQAFGTTNAVVVLSSSGQAIRSAYLSSGTLEAFYNGSSGGTATAAGTYNPSIERYIGSRWGASEGHYDGYFQELIWYPSDQSTNRSNIEDNINTFYDIY